MLESLHPFWKNVGVAGSDECWPWLLGTTKDGYGLVTWGGITRLAHRVAMECWTGRLLTKGIPTLHSCDNRPCCNPFHIRVGTNLENSRDMVERGRAATGLRNGLYTMPHRRPRNHGETNGMSRLKWPEVDEIRAELARGDMHKEIADRHGVSRSLISMIHHEKVWPLSSRPSGN